jgi:phosphate transport system substrate-binding protein
LPALRRSTWPLLSVALVAAFVSLVAAGCGGRHDSIRIDGSSTVFPIAEAAAEEFAKVSPGIRVNVGFSGTGGGLEKFCRGDIQVANASRHIKDSEAERCAENSIGTIVEFEIATDALSVVVNERNTWATCMTPEELHLAFKEGGARRWNEIRPDWPDEPIRVYHPGADSGTFDYFVEAIITSYDPSASHRSDGTSSEDDNVIISGLVGDTYALGYLGFAYYQEVADQVHAIAIDDGRGCVEPTADNAREGRYTPLSRPLLMYTTEELIRERDALEEFLAFYLDEAEVLSEEVGYIPLSDAAAAEQKDRLQAIVAGPP